MHADRILETLDTLSLPELRRVKAKVDRLVEQIEAWQQPEEEEHAPSGMTLRQEYVRCGKASCKRCAEGPGHGPYWYAYWSEGGKTRKQYIGKQQPS